MSEKKMSGRQFDYRENRDHLAEALRMAQSNVEPGSMFPYASMPLTWSHAQTLALVDIAQSLRDINTKLGWQR